MAQANRNEPSRGRLACNSRRDMGEFCKGAARLGCGCRALNVDATMPRYFFTVHDGLRDYPDAEGIEFATVRAAERYAWHVARDLLFRREAKRRHWLVTVRDETDRLLFALPFSAADPTIRRLPRPTKKLIQHISRRRFALAQAIAEAKGGVYSARATIARIKGKPYLAARNGQSVDDPPSASARRQPRDPAKPARR